MVIDRDFGGLWHLFVDGQADRVVNKALEFDDGRIIGLYYTQGRHSMHYVVKSGGPGSLLLPYVSGNASVLLHLSSYLSRRVELVYLELLKRGGRIEDTPPYFWKAIQLHLNTSYDALIIPDLVTSVLSSIPVAIGSL